MFSIGIVGLTNAGKSTLFAALTKKQVEIANYPFATIDPNVGVVEVPDERLDKLAELSKSRKKVPAFIEFVDIAGLVKGANKGEGLGNRFLHYIREVDAILYLVRAFEDENVKSMEGKVNPANDLAILKLELELKDMETSEETEKLSKKPYFVVVNMGKNNDQGESGITGAVEMNVHEELGASGLTVKERKDLGLGESKLNTLIKKAYITLGLISFFTINQEEIRAWTIKKGTRAQGAAGVIHTDFQKSFIRAQVIHWNKLLEAGSWQKAREQGLVITKGKDYIVQDGDVMLILHSK